MSDLFKIGVCIPAEYLDGLMDLIEDTIHVNDSHYSRAFSYWPVKGTWRTLDGANPFNGKIGTITVADEIRLEFVVDGANIEDVIVAIKEYHPYEEPVIDIIPMTDWRTFIPSDGM